MSHGVRAAVDHVRHEPIGLPSETYLKATKLRQVPTAEEERSFRDIRIFEDPESHDLFLFYKASSGEAEVAFSSPKYHEPVEEPPCDATAARSLAFLPELKAWDAVKLTMARKPLSREELAEINLDDLDLALDCCHFSGLFIRGHIKSERLSEEVVRFYESLVELETKLLKVIQLGKKVSGKFNDDKTAVVFDCGMDGGVPEEIVRIDNSSDFELRKFQLIGFYFKKPIPLEEFKWLAVLSSS